jgi:hypothetical protein
LLSPSTSQTTSGVIHDNGNWLGEEFGVFDAADWEADEAQVNAGAVGFIVELDEPATRDIQFNYWLESGEAALARTSTALAGR